VKAELGLSTTNGVGMFMWRQLFRWGIIAGLWLAGSTEVACTEKWLAKVWQEKYSQNAREKGIPSSFGIA